MSGLAEGTTGARPQRRGRQAAVGLGVMALVLGAIAAVSMVSNERQGLRAAVIGPRRAAPGEEVKWTVSIRDTAGSAVEVRVDFGDGTSAVPVRDRQPASCDPGRTATSESVELTHLYPAAGVYTARAQVVSGGCGAATERVEAIRTIKVKPLGG